MQSLRIALLAIASATLCCVADAAPPAPLAITKTVGIEIAIVDTATGRSIAGVRSQMSRTRIPPPPGAPPFFSKPMNILFTSEKVGVNLRRYMAELDIDDATVQPRVASAEITEIRTDDDLRDLVESREVEKRLSVCTAAPTHCPDAAELGSRLTALRASLSQHHVAVSMPVSDTGRAHAVVTLPGAGVAPAATATVTIEITAAPSATSR